MVTPISAGIFTGGAAALAAAIWLHDFFEGETLLPDLADEIRLNLSDLKALDRKWSENPRRSDAIVTLTTIPSRLPHILPTLKSLMRQSVAPRRIVLNLPEHSRRENCRYEIPDILTGLASLRIERCADLGPATKLLPTLAREQADARIIVVDDDRIYPANFVEDLDGAAAERPDAAFGFSGWVVPEDLVDRPTTIWSNLRMLAPAPIRARRLARHYPVDILQGFSGYLVRPRFFDLEQLNDYSEAPPEAFFVDDVWISGHCRAERFVIPARRSNYQRKLKMSFYKATSLGLINRGRGGDENRHNSIVIRHLKDRWRANLRNPEAA